MALARLESKFTLMASLHMDIEFVYEDFTLLLANLCTGFCTIFAYTERSWVLDFAKPCTVNLVKLASGRGVIKWENPLHLLSTV